MENTDFINIDLIEKQLLAGAKRAADASFVNEILDRAEQVQGLTADDVAVLVHLKDKEQIARMLKIADDIKQKIYGKRIVMFAPLYLGNDCVNGCVYCAYHAQNREIKRIKLTQEQIKLEAYALMDMGHKRLALEIGEHPIMLPIEYMLESIDTIYSLKHLNGQIRRVNVNIAATTIENYKKLHEAKIGTYILFQETYHKPTYERMHPRGPKSDYEYHTTAMDRAMAGGVEDVGIGVLYGLYDYKFDSVAMICHAKHLEDTFGVGPHTISLPRIRKANNVDLGIYQGIDDDTFLNIVAIMRLALPYAGIIISTRETSGSRADLLKVGVSQLSGGSSTGVGGYCNKETHDTEQFQVEDHRSLDEIVNYLAINGYMPSFCTACYREGRTGDRFMQLAKSGQIGNVCAPNALITFQEYLLDYASAETKMNGAKVIEREITKIKSDKVRELTMKHLADMSQNKRDFRF